MTFKQTSQLMDLFSAAYPRYYADQGEGQRKLAVKVWAKMLEDYPADIVTDAAQALITSLKFPPTISEVIEKIRLISQPRQIGEGEAWGLVQRAISNAGYHAQEEFDQLPPAVRSAVGSASVLRQWALVEIDDLETVVHSNFIKSFRSRAKADAEYQAIPASVRDHMAQIGGGIFKQLEGPA